MHRWLAVTAITMTILMVPLPALAGPVGQFSYVVGQVDITRPGEAARPAVEGDPLHVGDVVRTKSKSKAGIRFVDESLLRMAPQSRVEIKEYAVDAGQAQARLNLSRGKVQSIVKKLASRMFGREQRSWFEVQTPTAIIGVRGTDFVAYYLQGLSGAVFSEGQGYAFSINRPDQVALIDAGQAMLVVSPDQPPIIKPATESEIQQHRQDTMPEGAAQEQSAGEPPAAYPAAPIQVVPVPQQQELKDISNLPLPGPAPSPVPTAPQIPPALPQSGPHTSY